MNKTRCFIIGGYVRSRTGWLYDDVTATESLTDIQAITRFRHGIKGMRVAFIKVGGVEIWKAPKSLGSDGRGGR